MAESIIQEDTSYCFMCGRNSNFEPLDCHHIFGGCNRKNSEKYGLKVYLHHNTCHIFGKDSVHQNKEVMEYLHEVGQKAFERKYPNLSFREIFGKNYL